MINCGHWQPGVCTAGHFGGRPSPGTCAHCAHNPAHIGAGITPPNPETLVQLQRAINAETPEDTLTRFRRLWKTLHTRAFATVDLATEPAWLERWGYEIPCGECAEHFLAYCRENPPDFTAAGYARWGWALHNAVNRRLGKPEVTLAAATELYRPRAAEPVTPPG